MKQIHIYYNNRQRYVLTDDGDGSAGGGGHNAVHDGAGAAGELLKLKHSSGATK